MGLTAKERAEIYRRNREREAQAKRDAEEARRKAAEKNEND